LAFETPIRWAMGDVELADQAHAVRHYAAQVRWQALVQDSE